MELISEAAAHLSPRFAVTLGGYAVSFVALVGIAAFVLLKSERREVHIAFVLYNLSVSVYIAMFMLASAAPDADVSRRLWFVTVNDVFIAALFLHWVLALVGKAAKRRFILGGIYVGGIVLGAVALAMPDAFIPSVEPKMYFTNYPVAGPLYTAVIAYFVAVVMYAFGELVHSFRTANREMQNRLKYVILGSLVGYGTGTTSILLTYDIMFDPVVSMLLGLYSGFYAYAILRHRVMEIRVALERAALSAVAIGGIAWALFGLGFVNDILIESVSWIPQWAVPLAGSLIAFSVGYWVWRKAREAERIKNEFLTVAAHNLRTPLSRLRFAAEKLRDRFRASGMSEEADAIPTDVLVGQIANDAEHMIELADVLLKAADAEEIIHTREPIALPVLIEDVSQRTSYRLQSKNLTIHTDVPDDIPRAVGSTEHIRTVLRILIDNAIQYTPEGGTITLILRRAEGEVVCTVRDTGIGIAAEDLPHVFSRLFRGKDAQREQTEGIGLGLFLAKQVVERLDGRIWAESEGRGKGSAFSFSLPAANS